jgi:5S rRNA maturation endonuclease (ribonuclease M5)
MMALPTGWRRVSRGSLCPVCEHPDWCLVAEDGSAAICPRVESPRRIRDAGWLHRLQDSPWQADRGRVRHLRLATGGRGPDLAWLAAQYRRDVDPGRLCQLATALGLTTGRLLSLGIGWSGEHGAWSFPMRAPEGTVLGIRLRRPNGFKFAVKGGREGLFLPDRGDSESKTLLICEGSTDAAALLDMGFADVVGRPSCSGGIKLLVALVSARKPAEVVIVADGDEPGRRETDNLASVLVAYAPAVRVIAPPRASRMPGHGCRRGQGGMTLMR